MQCTKKISEHTPSTFCFIHEASLQFTVDGQSKY